MRFRKTLLVTLLVTTMVSFLVVDAEYTGVSRCMNNMTPALLVNKVKELRSCIDASWVLLECQVDFISLWKAKSDR